MCFTVFVLLRTLNEPQLSDRLFPEICKHSVAIIQPTGNKCMNNFLWVNYKSLNFWHFSAGNKIKYIVRIWEMTHKLKQRRFYCIHKACRQIVGMTSVLIFQCFRSEWLSSALVLWRCMSRTWCKLFTWTFTGMELAFGSLQQQPLLHFRFYLFMKPGSLIQQIHNNTYYSTAVYI